MDSLRCEPPPFWRGRVFDSTSILKGLKKQTVIFVQCVCLVLSRVPFSPYKTRVKGLKCSTELPVAKLPHFRHWGFSPKDVAIENLGPRLNDKMNQFIHQVTNLAENKMSASQPNADTHFWQPHSLMMPSCVANVHLRFVLIQTYSWNDKSNHYLHFQTGGTWTEIHAPRVTSLYSSEASISIHAYPKLRK